MPLKWAFAGVALLALLAGTSLFLGTRAPAPAASSPSLAPGALFAAGFTDLQGGRRSLGEFRGRILVVNFWATWCAPCREEMPAFMRLQERWSARGVQFVGLANEDPRRVERFARELAINYPLWVGGDEVSELSKRLGNRLGVLPYTVLLDRDGQVLEMKIGPYTERQLDDRLRVLAANAL